MGGWEKTGYIDQLPNLELVSIPCRCLEKPVVDVYYKLK